LRRSWECIDVLNLTLGSDEGHSSSFFANLEAPIGIGTLLLLFPTYETVRETCDADLDSSFGDYVCIRVLRTLIIFSLNLTELNAVSICFVVQLYRDNDVFDLASPAFILRDVKP
jgi:hypothetical protein